VEHVAGTKFKLKELRTSFGQILKDRGVSIESISKVMGHSTTKTTELYYARIRDISAFSEINDVWVRNNDTNEKKRIEKTLDGYA